MASSTLRAVAAGATEVRARGPELRLVLGADLSPDGKWLAYQSDETGAIEIHPFDDERVIAGAGTAAGGNRGGRSRR